MTIAVVWLEDDFLWCAADTRLVGGAEDNPTMEIASKIYVIPVAISAQVPGGEVRIPHFWTQYGFVYAGSTSPATMTAVTASTFLQKLVRPGDRLNPPTFNEMAKLVCRLANRFMQDSRRFGMDGKFSAAFFGWCPHEEEYKVAYIDGRDDGGSFRVEYSTPEQPAAQGEPWLVLGSAAKTFRSTLGEYMATEEHIDSRVPLRVIEKMVAEGSDRTVGGATSVGAAHKHGFELFCAVEPLVSGQSALRRVFNGLDLDAEVGTVGPYFVAVRGIA
ncbi:hypothetical protein [Mesorhizobium sp. L2C084A000]|uniref:hypothetical protein n=1 Tax=Mesorhizobium sp. L2C084A000 TaxID=1287116 RepID=UPI0003D043B8|nr:hypothetical protein [Mesorhizobium sp. L2C084A000]ESZ30436.1 hypothetical protein X734_04020 [Mesorhizobium sp. L2C084A000]